MALRWSAYSVFEKMWEDFEMKVGVDCRGPYIQPRTAAGCKVRMWHQSITSEALRDKTFGKFKTSAKMSMCFEEKLESLMFVSASTHVCMATALGNRQKGA